MLDFQQHGPFILLDYFHPSLHVYSGLVRLLDIFHLGSDPLNFTCVYLFPN